MWWWDEWSNSIKKKIAVCVSVYTPFFLPCFPFFLTPPSSYIKPWAKIKAVIIYLKAILPLDLPVKARLVWVGYLRETPVQRICFLISQCLVDTQYIPLPDSMVKLHSFALQLGGKLINKGAENLHFVRANWSRSQMVRTTNQSRHSNHGAKSILLRMHHDHHPCGYLSL